MQMLLKLQVFWFGWNRREVERMQHPFYLTKRSLTNHVTLVTLVFQLHFFNQEMSVSTSSAALKSDSSLPLLKTALWISGCQRDESPLRQVLLPWSGSEMWSMACCIYVKGGINDGYETGLHLPPHPICALLSTT